LGFKAESIHGDLKQNIRERIMRNFHNGMYQIVVGTDVISRGIDVKNIDAVINYDFPREISSYVHRIGRTGRGDNKGASYTFMSDNIDSTVIALEKHIGSKLNELKFAEFEYIQNQDNHYNRRSSSNHRFNNNKNKYHNH
jgi:superfamily II DNA/RNA helicase